MKHSPYKTTDSRIAWSCPWYRIRQDDIITPDGKPGVYNTVESTPAVWIVPVTDAGEIVLIHNYRFTIDKWCWEVPAGSQENGLSLIDTARKELKEEVGGTAAHMQQIGNFYTAPGFCNEQGYFFLATGVTLSKPSHESTEVMEIFTKPIDEVLRMVKNGRITDGNSALALLLCADRLNELAK